MPGRGVCGAGPGPGPGAGGPGRARVCAEHDGTYRDLSAGSGVTTQPGDEGPQVHQACTM